jgi:hypothetical protein
MDEKFEVEVITANCLLNRHVPVLQTLKDTEKRRFPTEAHFVLKDGEDGLSVNWDKYSSPERGLIVVGLMKGINGEFRKIDALLNFQIPSHICIASGINVQIEHKPLFHDNPSEVGQPNNKAHAEVLYTNEDLDVMVNLSDYCAKHIEAFCKVDYNALKADIEELKARVNDTEYHKMWNFENDSLK